jgi:hypothetical protein
MADIQSAFGAYLENIVLKESAIEVSGGTVYLCDVDLDAELASFAAEEEPPSSDDESPLEGSDIEWPTETLVDFEWVGGGPPGWAEDLELLDFGKPLAFVCWRRNVDSGKPWILVAGISPKDKPACFERVFALAEGSTLPTKITNYAPKLISRSTVLEAVRQFLTSNSWAWEYLLEEHGARGADSEGNRAAAIDSYFNTSYSE